MPATTVPAPATGQAAQAPPTVAARAAVLAAASLTLMAAAVIAPSLPAMADAFGGTPAAESAARLALTITSLAIAVTAPLAGAVTDRFGRRGVLLTGLVLYAVAGTAGALVPNLGVLIATRALLGVAVGGIITAVTATITDWFDGDRRARYLGLQQAAASLGGVVLLPVAGLLSGLGWRTPFWLYTIGALVGAAVFAAARDRGPASARPTAGPGTAPGRNAIAQITGVYVLALAATVVFYMAPTQVPFLLDDSGAGPTVVGLAIAASTLTGLFGALAYPVLWRHVPTSAITALGIAALGAGWLLVAMASLPGVFAGLLVGGLGVGVTVPNLNLVLGGLAPAVHRGRVLAGLVSGIFLGQFISPIAVAPLTAATGVAGAFAWTGAATLAASLLTGAAALVRTRPDHHHERSETMIVHGNRFTFKPTVSADEIEEALESLRNQGRSIPAVKSFTVGRDYGGEYEWGATFVLENLDGYWEYLTHPTHMRTDRIGLPLLDKFASFDITDDLDPEMSAKIAALHQRRYDQDAELTELVSNLNNYTGSAAPGPHAKK